MLTRRSTDVHPVTTQTTALEPRRHRRRCWRRRARRWRRADARSSRSASAGSSDHPRRTASTSRRPRAAARHRPTTRTAPSAEELDKPAVEAIVEEKLRKQKVLAGWKDGFFLESPSGDFKLKLRGYMQTQFRDFPHENSDTGTDSIFLRRVRPIFEGTVYKYFDYKIMPDFGQRARQRSRTPTSTSTTSSPGWRSAAARTRRRSASSACSRAPTCSSPSAPSRRTWRPTATSGSGWRARAATASLIGRPASTTACSDGAPPTASRRRRRPQRPRRVRARGAWLPRPPSRVRHRLARKARLRHGADLRRTRRRART